MYLQGHESNGCPLQIISIPYNCGGGRWHGRCSVCPTAKDKKNRLEMLPVLRMCVQCPFYQDNSNNMWQLRGTFILEANVIHIFVLNYIFLSSNILCFSLYIIAWKMKNLNKSNVLTSIESTNLTSKKCWGNNLKIMGTKCTQFCKSMIFFFCPVIQGFM